MLRNFRAPMYGAAGPQALPQPSKGAAMPMSGPKMAPQGAPMGPRPQMPMRGMGFMRPGAVRR